MNVLSSRRQHGMRLTAFLGLAALVLSHHRPATGSEPIVLAGPAMGTTYRVTLAADVPRLSRGEVHRELEAVLARIDRGCSTWRDDSDVSRFNGAASGEWIEVGHDLAEVVSIAREVYAETEGAFDITVAPLLDLWNDAHKRHRQPPPAAITAARAAVGMELVQLRRPEQGPAALRKHHAGVHLTLGGIGPGYAVDCLGERLVELGSTNHLVTLGGEARAWGTQADGSPWQIHVHTVNSRDPADLIELAAGEAVAFSTRRPGVSPIDPRSGRPCDARAETVMFRSSRCSHADAWAVALALGHPPLQTPSTSEEPCATAQKNPPAGRGAASRVCLPW